MGKEEENKKAFETTEVSARENRMLEGVGNPQEVSAWEDIAKKGKELFSYAQTLIKPDSKALEVVEKIEDYAKKKGLKFAFPVNISSDEIAAHFTPFPNDESFLGGLVKLDIGLMNDGFICDMAKSFDLTSDKKYSSLIKASEDALKNAISFAKEGIKLNKIGKVIHDTIANYGFSPIRNLCGHELKKYNLHSGLTIPNYDNNNEACLEENQIIAIEPFATLGIGIVQDGKPSGIYNLAIKKPIRDMIARKVLEFIEREYKTLPFCSRWILNEFGQRALFSLKLLEQEGIIHQYPQLVEKSKQPVSQSEHTILIKKNGCKVLTG